MFAAPAFGQSTSSIVVKLVVPALSPFNAKKIDKSILVAEHTKNKASFHLIYTLIVEFDTTVFQEANTNVFF